MDTAIDAGKLRERLEVLELRETQAGAWEWVSEGRTWGQVTLSDKRNLFSMVGIGARDAQLVLRRRPLTLGHALRWGGQHLFLTAIRPRGRGHLDVSAALVELSACRAVQDGTRFPGVLTEKYVRFEQADPYDVNDVSYVLVTPKAVSLTPGCLLEAGGQRWAVRTAHVLDPWKNEYELERKGDL